MTNFTIPGLTLPVGEQEELLNALFKALSSFPSTSSEERVLEILASGKVVGRLDTYNPHDIYQPGRPPLCHAAEVGSEKVVQALLEQKASPNFERCTSDGYRTPPIYWAVRSRKTSVVRLLLEGGADPNKYDGCIPAAVKNGDVEILGLLLAAGAKIPSASECVGLYRMAPDSVRDEINLILKNSAKASSQSRPPKSLLSWRKDKQPIDLATTFGAKRFYNSAINRGNGECLLGLVRSDPASCLDALAKVLELTKGDTRNLDVTATASNVVIVFQLENCEWSIIPLALGTAEASTDFVRLPSAFKELSRIIGHDTVLLLSDGEPEIFLSMSGEQVLELRTNDNAVQLIAEPIAKERYPDLVVLDDLQCEDEDFVDAFFVQLHVYIPPCKHQDSSSIYPKLEIRGLTEESLTSWGFLYK